MTRRLTIVVENKHCALVTGYETRQMLTDLRGRPPLWSPTSRAWVTTEAVARDLVALAELRGYEIVVTGPQTLMSTTTRSSSADHLADGGKILDPGRGLW